MYRIVVLNKAPITGNQLLPPIACEWSLKAAPPSAISNNHLPPVSWTLHNQQTLYYKITIANDIIHFLFKQTHFTFQHPQIAMNTHHACKTSLHHSHKVHWHKLKKLFPDWRINGPYQLAIERPLEKPTLLQLGGNVAMETDGEDCITLWYLCVWGWGGGGGGGGKGNMLVTANFSSAGSSLTLLPIVGIILSHGWPGFNDTWNTLWTTPSPNVHVYWRGFDSPKYCNLTNSFRLWNADTLIIRTVEMGSQRGPHLRGSTPF